MIPRYSRTEMARIWEPETRFRVWLRIETYAAEAMAELGLIPKHAADAVRKRGGFDIARIDEIEREVKHDVIAFLTSVAEHVGPEARFLHSGLTSSDVLDTCFNVQLVEAADVLIADTAGRLPTQLHLMEEIRKVKRVAGKALEGAPHEIVLVLEGQAKAGVRHGRDGHLRTVHAPKDGDAAIVLEARTASELGHEVVVVTADRTLAQRVEHLGCRTMSPSWLLSVISG